MTPFETTLHLAFALLPSLGVLAFLLLHQRQRNQAELADQLLHYQHCQARQEQESQRAAAFGAAAQAFAPVIGVALQNLFAKLDKSPPSVGDLSDEEIATELRRRVFGTDCDACQFTDAPTPDPESPEPPIN